MPLFQPSYEPQKMDKERQAKRAWFFPSEVLSNGWALLFGLRLLNNKSQGNRPPMQPPSVDQWSAMTLFIYLYYPRYWNENGIFRILSRIHGMSLAHGREFFYKKKLIRAPREVKSNWRWPGSSFFQLICVVMLNVAWRTPWWLFELLSYLTTRRRRAVVMLCMDGKTSKIYEFYWVEISTLHDLASLDWVMYHPPLLNFQPRKMFQLSKFKDPHTEFQNHIQFSTTNGLIGLIIVVII